LLELGPRRGFDLDRELDALSRSKASIALVLLPGVQYLTGERRVRRSGTAHGRRIASISRMRSATCRSPC
jgi:hypothetical protein